MLVEYSVATTEFLAYNMTQMLRHSAVITPSQLSHCPEVPEPAAQQDETIRGIATTEEEQYHTRFHKTKPNAHHMYARIYLFIHATTK